MYALYIRLRCFCKCFCGERDYCAIGILVYTLVVHIFVCECVPRCVRFVFMRFNFGKDFQILADLSKLNGMCRNVFKAFLGIGYVLALINYA